MKLGLKVELEHIQSSLLSSNSPHPNFCDFVTHTHPHFSCIFKSISPLPSLSLSLTLGAQQLPPLSPDFKKCKQMPSFRIPVWRFFSPAFRRQVNKCRKRQRERMSYNPKPLQVSSVAAPSIAPSADGQPAGQNAPQQPPSISQAAKLTPQPASQLTQAVNNLHVLAAGGGERLAQMHLQQQMVNFQNQTLLFQQQAGNPSGEPLALTRVVAEAAAKQANGSVSIVPQAAAHGPSMAHQLHTVSNFIST